MQIEKGALERIVASLNQNQPARAVPLNEEEGTLVKGLQLLTMKPMIYAANVAETDLADQGASNQENCEVIIVSAQVWHVWLTYPAGIQAVDSLQGSCYIEPDEAGLYMKALAHATGFALLGTVCAA